MNRQCQQSQAGTEAAKTDRFDFLWNVSSLHGGRCMYPHACECWRRCPRPFRGRLLLGHPLQTPTTPRDSSLKIPPKGCRFWISDMTGTQSPWFLPGEDSIGVAARSRFQCSMRGSTFLGLALLLSFISSSAECAGGTKPNLCRVGGGCPRAIRRGLSPLACRLMRLRGGGNYYR